MVDLAQRLERETPKSAWTRLAALEARVKEIASAINTVKQASATTLARGIQVDDNTETFPNFTWTEFAVTEVPVPAGFTRATVTLYATVGGTFTGGGGNVGVTPFIGDYINDIYWLQGPPVSNGTFGAGPVSCSSVAFLDIAKIAGPTIRLSALCQSTNGTGTVVAGSNNVHLSAGIVFGR